MKNLILEMDLILICILIIFLIGYIRKSFQDLIMTVGEHVIMFIKIKIPFLTGILTEGR